MTTPEFPFLPDHNELIRNRYAKADALRAAGQNPYPALFEANDTAAAILAEPEALIENARPLSVLGRAMTIRSFGKTAFFHLRDRSGLVQVYVKKGLVPEEDFEVFREHVDGGDLVGVTGKLFRTKTGEATIEASSIRLCSKSVRQLPEKWHGFKDVELRYRQRYVDLIANPDVAEVFRKRSRIVSAMRRFLDDTGFMEVETPMMHPIFGGASARPFHTHHNTLDMPLYMRIAPELYLKRLVVGGLDRVYEINRNFRNEGISVRHNPEFTMLELYAGGWNASRMMDFVEEIIRATARGALSSLECEHNGVGYDFAKPIERVRYVDVIGRVLGVDVDWGMSLEDIRARAGDRGIPSDVKSADDAIIFLFEEHCEGALVQPTFVTEFAKSVSPLAKSVDGRPEVADRFELYIGGMEIANGYSELNDPREQYQRFAEQVGRRAQGDLEATGEIDEDYVRALEYGMVPTAGLGVGIDRLTMILTGAASIRDVILFPLLRPLKNEELAEQARLEQETP